MQNKNGKKAKRWIVLKTLLIILLALMLAFGCFLIVLTADEYRPPARETLPVPRSMKGTESSEKLTASAPLRLMSWNIGYGSLGKDADFFMDGGKQVLGLSKAVTEDNMAAIIREVKSQKPNFLLLQEVDEASKRSFYVNERHELDEQLGGGGLFAYNYRAFVPYPWPILGKISAGLYSSWPYATEEATRVQLPVPFKWPVRLANLKRCLLVARIPIAGETAGQTGGKAKELVMINLHMEAYDNTGGRERQTAELLELMKDEYQKGNYVIAGGDWNQSFLPASELKFTSENKNWMPGLIPRDQIPNGFQLLCGGPQTPSCRLDNAPYRKDSPESRYFIIDGFLLSPNVEALRVETLPLDFQYSDHNPVMLTFQLKK